MIKLCIMKWLPIYLTGMYILCLLQITVIALILFGISEEQFNCGIKFARILVLTIILLLI